MRSHYCGQLNETLVDQEVTLCGWVHRRRDHGGVIFLDMRDRDGIAQVVFDPDTQERSPPPNVRAASSCCAVHGRVRLRPEGTENPNMPTGMVEVLGKDVEVLNTAATPPFPLDEHGEVGEEVRLQLPVHRPAPPGDDRQAALALADHPQRTRTIWKGRVSWISRRPILTRATPEGARDYLVPSRTHAGHFFALAAVAAAVQAAVDGGRAGSLLPDRQVLP